MIESSAARERSTDSEGVTSAKSPAPRRLRCPYLTVSPGKSPLVIALEKREEHPGHAFTLCNRTEVRPPNASTAPGGFNRFAYCRRRADPPRLPAGPGTDQERGPGVDRGTDPMPGRGTGRERRGARPRRAARKHPTQTCGPPPPRPPPARS